MEDGYQPAGFSVRGFGVSTPDETAKQAKLLEHLERLTKRGEIEGEWKELSLNGRKVKRHPPEYRLPGTIYSSGIITLFGFFGYKLTRRRDCSKIKWTKVCRDLPMTWPAYGLIVINYVLQGGLTVYIIRAANGMDECHVQERRSFRLLFLAIAVFVAVMIFEIMETYDMFNWILYLNITENGDEEDDAEGEMSDEEDEDSSDDDIFDAALLGVGTSATSSIHATRSRWRKVFWKKFDTRLDPTTGEKTLLETAELVGFVGPIKKVLAVAVFIVPKLIIAIALLIAGCKFLMANPTTTDVILDAVALQFVVQIDEFLFQAFTTSKKKKYLEELPPVRQPASTFAWAVTKYCWRCLPHSAKKIGRMKDNEKEVACDSWINWTLLPWIKLAVGTFLTVFFFMFFRCRGTVDFDPPMARSNFRTVAEGLGNVTLVAV